MNVRNRAARLPKPALVPSTLREPAKPTMGEGS